MNEFIRLTEK